MAESYKNVWEYHPSHNRAYETPPMDSMAAYGGIGKQACYNSLDGIHITDTRERMENLSEEGQHFRESYCFNMQITVEDNGVNKCGTGTKYRTSSDRFII